MALVKAALGIELRSAAGGYNGHGRASQQGHPYLKTAAQQQPPTALSANLGAYPIYQFFIVTLKAYLSRVGTSHL